MKIFHQRNSHFSIINKPCIIHANRDLQSLFSYLWSIFRGMNMRGCLYHFLKTQKRGQCKLLNFKIISIRCKLSCNQIYFSIKWFISWPMIAYKAMGSGVILWEGRKSWIPTPPPPNSYFSFSSRSHISTWLRLFILVLIE